MRKMRTLLSVILISAMILCMLVSCKDNTDDTDTNDTNDTNDTPSTYDISEFTIIRPDLSGTNIVGVISALRNSLLKNVAVELGVAIDVDTDEIGEYELLIGATNRDESIAALNELKAKTSKEAFCIKIYDKKIVIVGLSEDDTVLGVTHFMTQFVEKSTAKGCLPVKAGDMIAQKTGKVVAFTKDYHAITVEHSGTLFTPANGMEVSNHTYGKIIKLEHNGNNNGILFATSESSTGDPYPLFKSVDDGKTWQKVNDIFDSVNQGATLGYQPYLYELPVDMGKYPKGTILFACCSRPGASTCMSLQASTDLGATWEPVCNVDVGGTYNNGGWSSDGLWEPVLMYEEETGRLYCFYSDETLNGEGDNHAGGYNQRLVYKYTSDLENWSEIYNMVAFDDPELRPGMVAITRMGDGRYALAYEICAFSPSGQIHIKYADSLDGWNPTERGKPVKNATGAYLATAPAIAWTPLGGDCGTLIVVAQRSINDNTGSHCAMFLSFDYGETFVTVKDPFTSAKNPDVSTGYSPGFFVDKDGAVYYVNNPPAYPINDKLAFVKLKIY